MPVARLPTYGSTGRFYVGAIVLSLRSMSCSGLGVPFERGWLHVRASAIKLLRLTASCGAL